MSSKLTNEKLKELIKRNPTREEDKLSLDDTATAIDDMLGENSSWAHNKGVAGNKMKQLAKADPSGDEDDIEIIDFDDAVDGNKSQQDAVDAVAKHGTTNKIKKPAKDALKGVSTSSKDNC